MKKLLFFAVVVLFQACNSGQAGKTFEFTGQILNPAEGQVIIIKDQTTDTISLDSNRFTWKTELSRPQYLLIRHGQAIYQVFAAPGENLQMSFDYHLPDQVPAYKGSLAGENTYVAERTEFDNEQRELEQSLETSTEEDFLAINDSLRRLREQLLSQAEPDFKSSWSDEFHDLEKELIKTVWINRHMEYELYFPYLSGIENFRPSEKFLAYRREIDPNKPELLVLDEYVGMLEYYIEVHKKSQDTVDLSLTSTSEELLRFQFNMIDRLISNETVREEVRFRSVEEYMEARGAEGLESFYAGYIKTVNAPARKNKLEALYRKWGNLQPGSPAPEIHAVDNTGKEVSIDQLKGRYVYVEFWTTYSGPSLGELSKMDELTENYPEKDFAFVCISLDDEAMLWKNKVAELSLKSMQWYALKDEVIPRYNILKIPRFVLLDKEGRIITSNAPRPSGNIRVTLDSLSAVPSI